MVFALSVTATVAWAWTGGVQQIGLPTGPERDPVVIAPARTPGHTRPHPGKTWSPFGPAPTTTGPATPGAATRTPTRDLPGAPAVPGAGQGRAGHPRQQCVTGEKLVPTCGVLWGVAPGAFTDARGARALEKFEKKTQRRQDIYHAYHKGERQLFPTESEISIARQPGKERILFLNWKPTGVSWAKIAKGDKKTDAFLDQLAKHINHDFPEQFFFTVHHEAEDNVREKRGSGYEAEDYAAMYKHVVQRLRADGVHNLVTVLVHMAYVPHTSQAWFEKMYPGDSVVDWIGFDTYAYSDPGYGHGDFAELLNRRMESKPTWPGFYNWAQRQHPGKPLMVAEWGVWSSKKNPGHKAQFYREVGKQISEFPNIRALIAFDTPHNQDGRDSRVDSTKQSLAAYRWLGHQPVFRVNVRPLLP
jgi:hypothetical protein